MESNHIVIADLRQQESAQYGACGHDQIVAWTAFSGIVSGVAGDDVHQIRKALHDTGHLAIYTGDNKQLGDGIKDLHLGLDSVMSKVVGSGRESSLVTDAGKDFEKLMPIDAELSALQLRLTSVGLIEGQGQLPDLELMKSIWSKIARHPSDEMKGIVVANVMAVFKKADEAMTPRGQESDYTRSSEFARLVMQTSKASLVAEQPSGLRRWFVQSLYSGYHNAVHAEYSKMLKFGSVEEVDVALSSLEIFSKQKTVGGKHRADLIPIYKRSLEALLDGVNKNADKAALATTYARYGDRLLLEHKAKAIIAAIS